MSRVKARSISVRVHSKRKITDCIKVVGDIYEICKVWALGIEASGTEHWALGIVGKCREKSRKVRNVGKCPELLRIVGKCLEIRVMKIIDFSTLANLVILRPFSERSPVRKCLEMPY